MLGLIMCVCLCVCVQADPGYTQRQHQGGGLWANNRLAARPCTENNYPRRDSLGHASESKQNHSVTGNFEQNF